MIEISLLSKISLYVLLFLMGMVAIIVFVWQANVFRGKAIKNVDGSYDSWHEQKILYGMAFADLVFACPVTIGGIVLVFINPQWGHFLLSLASFWFVWANIMTTSTSLRFENPKITLSWFIAFPFGSLLGLAYIIWTVVHFDSIFIH